MAQPWDYIAKIVSLGDSGCGKSSLTVRLCEGRFSPHHDVTIGVEFGSRIVPVGPPASHSLSINNPSKADRPPSPSKKDPQQKHMKLSLWDTAGQETYKSITRSYFRGASGALLIFDITRKNTFLSATSWLNDLRVMAEEGIVVVLVGNKSDLAPSSTVSEAEAANKRQVTREEAEEWCKANGVMQYVETSAKSRGRRAGFPGGRREDISEHRSREIRPQRQEKRRQGPWSGWGQPRWSHPGHERCREERQTVGVGRRLLLKFSKVWQSFKVAMRLV